MRLTQTPFTRDSFSSFICFFIPYFEIVNQGEYARGCCVIGDDSIYPLTATCFLHTADALLLPSPSAKPAI